MPNDARDYAPGGRYGPPLTPVDEILNPPGGDGGLRDPRVGSVRFPDDSHIEQISNLIPEQEQLLNQVLQMLGGDLGNTLGGLNPGYSLAALEEAALGGIAGPANRPGPTNTPIPGSGGTPPNTETPNYGGRTPGPGVFTSPFNFGPVTDARYRGGPLPTNTGADVNRRNEIGGRTTGSTESPLQTLIDLQGRDPVSSGPIGDSEGSYESSGISEIGSYGASGIPEGPADNSGGGFTGSGIPNRGSPIQLDPARLRDLTGLYRELGAPEIGRVNTGLDRLARPSILGTEDGFETYYNDVVRDPLLENFEENILPGISRRFAGNALFDTERQQADASAQEDFGIQLERGRSRAALDIENLGLQRQTASAGANLSALDSILSQTLGRGQADVQSGLDRSFRNLLSQRETDLADRGLNLQDLLSQRDTDLADRGLNLQDLLSQRDTDLADRGLNLQDLLSQRDTDLADRGLNLQDLISQRETGLADRGLNLQDLLSQRGAAVDLAGQQRNASTDQLQAILAALSIPGFENIAFGPPDRVQGGGGGGGLGGLLGVLGPILGLFT